MQRITASIRVCIVISFETNLAPLHVAIDHFSQNTGSVSLSLSCTVSLTFPILPRYLLTTRSRVVNEPLTSLLTAQFGFFPISSIRSPVCLMKSGWRAMSERDCYQPHRSTSAFPQASSDATIAYLPYLAGGAVTGETNGYRASWCRWRRIIRLLGLECRSYQEQETAFLHLAFCPFYMSTIGGEIQTPLFVCDFGCETLSSILCCKCGTLPTMIDNFSKDKFFMFVF